MFRNTSSTDFLCCLWPQIKAASVHKGPYDFDLLVPVQDLSGEHMVSSSYISLHNNDKLIEIISLFSIVLL